MSERKLFDNLYKVIKANSGSIPASQSNPLTEIMDLQIPRGYCARIRKVIAELRNVVEDNQAVLDWGCRCALVLDPDDETSYYIPTFTVDHDVACDFRWDASSILQGTSGLGHLNQLRKEIDFDETLDVVTVRNVRFNTFSNNFADTDAFPQVDLTIYFTYEKISVDLYQKLLGIS